MIQLDTRDLANITGGSGTDPRIDAKAGAFDFIAGGGPAGPAGWGPNASGGGGGGVSGGGGGGGGKAWLLDPKASRDMIVY